MKAAGGGGIGLGARVEELGQELNVETGTLFHSEGGLRRSPRPEASGRTPGSGSRSWGLLGLLVIASLGALAYYHSRQSTQ